MTDLVIVDVFIMFIRWVIPAVGVLSLVLIFRPKLFLDLEKRLSKEFNKKKSSRKNIALLEEQNMALQNALKKNSQLVGLLCFILSIVIISKIY